MTRLAGGDILRLPCVCGDGPGDRSDFWKLIVEADRSMRSNLKTFLMAGLAMCLMLSTAMGEEPSGVTVEKSGSKQPTLILLKNRFLEMTFDPARGGRCSRLLVRATGEQVIGDADVSGLFLDHWAKYAWPSDLSLIHI